MNKTKMKNNLIFALIGILVISILTPFSVMATDSKVQVKFDVGNSSEQIVSRTIKLWKYNISADDTTADKILNDIRNSFNNGTLENELGQPLNVNFRDIGNFVLTVDLPKGYYVGVEEVVSVSGKKLSALHAFEVKASMEISSKYSVPDEPGKIILIKTDDKGNTLANVGFRLFFAVDHPHNQSGDLKAVDISVLNSGYSYDSSLTGMPIDLYTNSNGRIEVSNLPAGNYVLREVKALSGYTIEQRDTFFNVMQNGVTQKTVINRPGGGFNFQKIDSKTKQPLEGAKFVLMTKSGDMYLNVKDNSGKNIVLVSDVNGMFSVSGLAYGKYYLWEVSAPSGYKLLSEPVEFEIGDGTSTLLSSIENKPGTPPPTPPSENTPNRPIEIPKTGDITIIVMCIVGAIMVGMGRYFIREDSIKNM